MELTLDQALQKGIEAHKAGKVQEADRYYTAILKANPKHADANHNMGVLAVGVGKVEEALPFFKAALEVNQTVDQFWLSYIDALIRLNEIEAAEGMYKKAESNGIKGEVFSSLKHRINKSCTSKDAVFEVPRLSKDQIEPLMAFYNQGQFKKVFQETQKLVQKYSTDVFLWNLMGIAAAKLGLLDKAFELFNRALSINPNYSDAYNNIGGILKDQGKLKDAVAYYEKAISFKPDYAEAYYNLGNTLKEQGQLEKTIEAYKKAISFKPDYTEAYRNMGAILTSVTFHRPDPDLQKIILSLICMHSFVRPNNIVNAALSLLKFEPIIQEEIKLLQCEGKRSQNIIDVVSELSRLTLLTKFMSICPLPDFEIEKVLTNIRSGLLPIISSIEISPRLLKFQSALALQCFYNEYIYNYSKEEKKCVRALEQLAKNAFINKKQPSPSVILMLASYKALNNYDWCQQLMDRPEIKDVYRVQVKEPKKEAQLKLAIPLMKKVADKVSAKVKAQYEDNPYPKWVNLGLHFKPLSISEVADEIKLKLHDYKICEVKQPNVLIAGCGTGQHAIVTASRFKSSKVLAIDLSLSSLAYAQRKTDELKVRNIEYLQANILDLNHLTQKYDIIESSGVLHHMANPIEGWRNLTDHLKPGGLMKIGLYSELARKHICKIRGEISQKRIGSSITEMKSLREFIVKSKEDHHKLILNSSDFYCLSDLRDLLFHVKEHRFTLPQIKDYLENLGLSFCGFEMNAVIKHFERTNTRIDDLYDLDKWHTYEQKNSRSFAGMYQFWCQKVSSNY